MKFPASRPVPLEGMFSLESGLELVIHPHISGFTAMEWNSCLRQDEFFMRYEFLDRFASTAPANMTFYYAMYTQHNHPVAVAYFQVITLTSDEIASIVKPVSETGAAPKITGQWSEWLQRRKKNTGMRMMIVGNNFVSGEHAVSMTNDADPRQVYFSLAETVKLITKQDVAPVKISSIIVKDFFDGKGIASDLLVKKRYHRFIVEPEMIVHIRPEWKTFDDYLDAMSKKYRARAKGVMKKSAPLKVIEVDADYLEENIEQIYSLYLNLHNKAKFKLSALTQEYFLVMKKNLGRQFGVWSYELDGEIVAFRCAYGTSTHLEAHFIGIDYRFNAEYNLYQRLLYDYVKEAIDGNFSTLYLGRTASEMKTTVGAMPHDLVCYIRHRNSFSNQVIRPFIDYLRPSEWTPRHPFD